MITGWTGVIVQCGYSEQIWWMRKLPLSVILLLMLLLLPSITVAESAAKLQTNIVWTEEGALLGAESTVAQTWFEEDDPAVDYIGTWNSLVCNPCSNGSLKYSGQTGAMAEFSFYGTGLRWTTARAPVMGKAKLYFNGVYKGMIDLYNPVVKYPVVLEGKGLPLGNYTLTIEVSGQKNPGSTGNYTIIDAFEVVP
ncbi:MAG: hypothetical protein A2Z47_02780 [Thermodesulfovibrio sp. RBG_19FT_COMBO_42_12]|nr:MAG: hypothetical protein A2Z47_02780 [Thermodesulfovibrio sp. RBG_19FT_COMBO_42_12]